MPGAPQRRISPGDGRHYFFGYYDVPALSPDGRRHLFHRVSFRDRLPGAEDAAELGVLDLATGEAGVFATTRAWNFQQGAMLQWWGGAPDTVIYNSVGRDGAYRAVIQGLADGVRREADRAVASVSADGRLGLSINFDRMYDFRPGYGYAARADAGRGQRHPADDGVFLVDLRTGSSRLILSLAQLHARLRDLSPLLEEKLLINHLMFNPSATRFVALVRNFPVPLPAGMKQDLSQIPGKVWKTTVITADLAGGDVRVLIPAGYASHFHWRDDGVIAFHSDGPQGPQLYEITDAERPVFTAVDPGFFLRDGHCSYSPDRRWMLYDSYPDEAGKQHLYLYDLRARSGSRLASLEAAPVALPDLRCDLHPRWRPDGAGLTLDSTHEGVRAIYALDLPAARRRDAAA
jgi:hypothetical protein